MAHAFAAPLAASPKVRHLRLVPSAAEADLLESLLGPREPAGEFAPLTSVREPRLRLTRRGRFVLIALPIFLATVLLLAGLAALISPARAGDAAPVGTHTVQVTVQQGQSLWTVAAEYAPDRDPRAVIGEIIELNSLDSARVLPGQQLLVPSAH